MQILKCVICYWNFRPPDIFYIIRLAALAKSRTKNFFQEIFSGEKYSEFAAIRRFFEARIELLRKYLNLKTIFVLRWKDYCYTVQWIMNNCKWKATIRMLVMEVVLRIRLLAMVCLFYYFYYFLLFLISNLSSVKIISSNIY